MSIGCLTMAIYRVADLLECEYASEGNKNKNEWEWDFYFHVLWRNTVRANSEQNPVI